MGADLYIRSITDPAREKHTPPFNDAVKSRDVIARKSGDNSQAIEAAQALVEKYYDAMYPDTGYFRDSYNNSSLFWVLGLSWWNDTGDLLDDDGNLSVDNARKLLAMVESAPLDIPDGAGKKAEAYFTEKRARFIAFLKRAIELNEPIYCSI
jgi:hypothetical protein